MMRIYFFFFVFFFFFCLGCQKKEATFQTTPVQDSITSFITKANNFETDSVKRAVYIEKALALINKQENDSLNLINRLKLSIIYYNNAEYQKQKIELLNINDISIQLKDSINLARSFVYLSDFYKIHNVIDSSYFVLYKAEKIYKQLKDNLRLADLYLKKSNIYFNQKDYISSEKYSVLALNYLKLQNNADLQLRAYIILGCTSLEMQDYQKAQYYFNKSLKLLTQNKITYINQPKVVILYNLGILCRVQKKHKESILYFDEAINQPKLKYEDMTLYASIIEYRALSNFDLRNYKNVKDDLYNSNKIFENYNEMSSLYKNQIHISEYYQFFKQKDSAIKYAKKAYDNAKVTNIIPHQLDALEQIKKVDEINHRKYAEEYITLSDSLAEQERKILGKFARIEYETDQIIAEKDVVTKEKKQLLNVSIIVFVLSGLLFLLFRQRSKQKQLVLVQNQQKANAEIYQLLLDQQIKFDKGREKEKKRIAKELHDGIMNKIASIRFNLFVLEKKNDQETIQKCIEHVGELHTVEKEIREIAHDLNQEVFSSKSDYASLIKALIKDYRNQNGLEIHLELDKEIQWESVPSFIKMNIYRILQESLFNITKHAEATKVQINIIMNQQLLELDIQDNGVGLKEIKKKGIGLKNIQERVNECKGKFNISSNNKIGTHIQIHIPNQNND